MAREVSDFMADLRSNLESQYPGATWLLATPATGIDDVSASVFGTIAVNDSEELDETAIDRMTGAWYVDLPLVISLYFNRAVFVDYELPRDFAFSIAAWFRKRLVGIPSQAVSETGTMIRQTEITQAIEGGVDTQILHNWLLWQVMVAVPLAITPEFPAIPGLANDTFRSAQGPPAGPEYYFERIYISDDPFEDDPSQAEQIVP